MKKLVGVGVVAAVALALAVVAVAGTGPPIDRSWMNEVTLAVYGDAPYGTSNDDTAEFNATPAFVDAVNRDPKVSLVVHVGDIHSAASVARKPMTGRWPASGAGTRIRWSTRQATTNGATAKKRSSCPVIRA